MKWQELYAQLYTNWVQKLARLKREAEKRDFSPEGEAAYDVAYAEAKQAYALLCDVDTQPEVQHVS